jgi:hypothetical protein
MVLSRPLLKRFSSWRAMLRQVEAGIQAGKSVDTLAEEINLTRYQPFGAEPRRTAGQVRSMYRKLAANEPRK